VIIEVTETERDVIRDALRVSIKESSTRYHRAAVGASEEEALRLSVEYQEIKECLCRLLRKVGDARMDDSTATAPDDHEEGNDDD
jgi:hypothetical protein